METAGQYQFAPEERPLIPGGPFSTSHALHRRLGYGAVGIAAGLAGTFPNGLITVNVPNLSGPLGVYVVQAALLPAIYVAMNATGKLSLVKGRCQFGIFPVANFLLLFYAAAGLLQIPFPGFLTAALVRAASGLTAAGLTCLAIYYFLQVFTPKTRPLALVIVMGLLQLGPVLARLVPVDALAANGWYGLHLIEPAVAFFVLTLINTLPLPPNERGKAFEKLDFVTVGLIVPAMLLVCGVLGVGRYYWWSDAPWLGWMSAAAIPLFATAILIEG